MNETSFQVVVNLVVDILLGKAFMVANVRMVSLGKQMIHTINSNFVDVKGTNHNAGRIAQVDDMVGQRI